MRSEELLLWFCFSPSGGQGDWSSSQQPSHQCLNVEGMISTLTRYRSPALKNNFARDCDPICTAGSWNNEPVGNGACTTFPCGEKGPTQTPCKPHFSSFTFETTLRADSSLDASSLGVLDSSEKSEFRAPQDLVQNARTRASCFGAANGQKWVSREATGTACTAWGCAIRLPSFSHFLLELF